MDPAELFTDPELADEFLDRFEDLKAHAPTSRPGMGGAALESLDVLGAELTRDNAAAAVTAMREGTYEPDNSALEAIIERFTARCT